TGPAAGNDGYPALPEAITHTLNLAGSGYIRIANDPHLNPAGAITLEAWVRRSSLSCETVVGKNYATGYWLGFCNGSLRFYNGFGLTDGTVAVTVGAWNHIAVSYDGCNMRFYLNGFLDKAVTCLTAHALPVTTDNWAIGANNDGAFGFHGSI